VKNPLPYLPVLPSLWASIHLVANYSGSGCSRCEQICLIVYKNLDNLSFLVVTIPSSQFWWSVTFGNGVFVAVAGDSPVAANLGP
jgi:hypothetical protein